MPPKPLTMAAKKLCCVESGTQKNYYGHNTFRILPWCGNSNAWTRKNSVGVKVFGKAYRFFLD